MIMDNIYKNLSSACRSLSKQSMVAGF